VNGRPTAKFEKWPTVAQNKNVFPFCTVGTLLPIPVSTILSERRALRQTIEGAARLPSVAMAAAAGDQLPIDIKDTKLVGTWPVALAPCVISSEPSHTQCFADPHRCFLR